MIIYIVKEGDSVDTIAGAFGVSVWTIIEVNQLTYPYPLAIGQSLLILTTPLEEYRTIFANGFAYPFINLDILDETLPFLSELSVFSYGFSV